MIEIRSPLFASLPDAALARLRDAVLPRVFAPGEAMVNEGETLEELFIVVRGDALVVGRDWHGQKHTLARLGPGECFGELSMLSGEPASATVEALTETEVWVLPHAAAIAISDEYPALARNFSSLLADRLRLSNERTLEIMQGKIVQESCTRADVAIQPVFKSPPGLLDFRKGRELEGAGEEAAEQALPRLRVVLPWLA